MCPAVVTVVDTADVQSVAWRKRTQQAHAERTAKVFVTAEGSPGHMGSRRGGRGSPIDQRQWPTSGPTRNWLSYCNKVHQANGLPSRGALAEKMGLTSRTRVNDMLRGLALPADQKQARALLEALGAVDKEVDRGIGLYKTARTEYEQAKQAARGVDHPGWWLRSGYVEQVGDIAPLELVDREPELDELAAWCTAGDEQYMWWQAEPKAGKSALMAWFVLHPPPDVWVVSFFVTARYAGQADSTAFTDGLLDQLAAITGTRLPPLTSATERDGLRRRLLGEAAARAGRSGRRLVLIVDGLDEDCGSLPGSGLPSIAASLPRRPPDGLRVIVAGRPDPPLPDDVTTEAGHPLHHCRLRLLDPSPYATRVTELAQQELDEVLAHRPRPDEPSMAMCGQKIPDSAVVQGWRPSDWIQCRACNAMRAAVLEVNGVTGPAESRRRGLEADAERKEAARQGRTPFQATWRRPGWTVSVRDGRAHRPNPDHDDLLLCGPRRDDAAWISKRRPATYESCGTCRDRLAEGQLRRGIGSSASLGPAELDRRDREREQGTSIRALRGGLPSLGRHR